MPIIPKSSYPKPPFYQYNGHLQTVLPAILRSVKGVNYERERITLSDGDFVDLDWIDNKSKQLVILSHGLEGNTTRHYIKGMAKHFSTQKWDILAWNCRSCSGEMNRKIRLYNHGEIGDFGEVIEHALGTKDYEKVVLIGFSMGGNITMKYLGVNGKNIPGAISRAIAFSSPCDLTSSVALLDERKARFYRNRFLKLLKAKITQKAKQFPDQIDLSYFSKIKMWKDFDEYYSAPINGYKNADDFYYQGSAINFMSDIQIPTLLVNALNDPILTPACFPTAFCQDHPYIYLETPQFGGHVGFAIPRQSYAWSEQRSWEFVHEDL